MDLCTGAGREALTVADRFRAQMLRACPYIPQGTLPENASLTRVISEEDVEFAKGNSDDETIREYCRESEKQYRRILKADVDENGSLSFPPAFVHEEDDRVGVKCSSQPSFHVLQEEIGTYEEDFAENPYIQAIPRDAWQALFSQPLSSVQLPIHSLFFGE